MGNIRCFSCTPSYSEYLTRSLGNSSLKSEGRRALKISARGRYSMQALFDLAHHSHGQPVPLHAIAERQGISLPFLEQIFHKLRKAGVVTSVRGPRGGYVMTRACDKLSVGEVLRLTDPGFYASAKEDPKEAAGLLNQDRIMTHLLWRQLNEHIVGFMETVTIADLCSETHANTCIDCTCPEYVKEVQAKMQNGRPMGCAALLS